MSDVSGLRISEVAERAGVPTSTLRYYERIGLVEPVGRAENGYRLYDDTTLDRLAFIGRAKRLGMTLEDAATLAGPWFAGECGPLQGRLRTFVTGRIAEVRRRIAEDRAFERQLERILGRLGQADGVAERCGPDCGCDTDPLESADPAVVCSLAGDDMDRRLNEWRRVLALARRAERAEASVRAVFAPSAPVVTELARLCAAEMQCCPFFTFTLDMAADAVVLEIEGDRLASGFLDQICPLDGRS